ncbi:hypothetical protein GTO89_06010 [Heliobacterium gestii]|uniref:Uncharacterized protein n=1 Tax=Heliomicrobium gestii TaxID=2699 RepID=A0A845LAJ5_HELGE|nr:hypothetical protein [Heliomicrobium gestii]MBM7866082.1 hypothetical protein [Heliomicrobium gestii]MZP42591.1 hypothetical protein [Heliomicrobium gestii]
MPLRPKSPAGKTGEPAAAVDEKSGLQNSQGDPEAVDEIQEFDGISGLQEIDSIPEISKDYS